MPPVGETLESRAQISNAALLDAVDRNASAVSTDPSSGTLVATHPLSIQKSDAESWALVVFMDAEEAYAPVRALGTQGIPVRGALAVLAVAITLMFGLRHRQVATSRGDRETSAFLRADLAEASRVSAIRQEIESDRDSKSHDREDAPSDPAS